MGGKCRDQDIKISPRQGEVSVKFNGKTVARTNRALDLVEASYPTVIYIPLADVDENYLSASEHTSFCPFKGEASYYSLQDGDKNSENAVWYYDAPCPLVAKIKDHVAFWGSDITYESAD